MLKRQAKPKTDASKTGVTLLVIKDETWLQCERCGARWKPYVLDHTHGWQCPHGCRTSRR